MRLGYACINSELRKENIFSSRTAREATIKQKGIQHAVDLFGKNLDDTLKILQWNEEHGIRFFRISSNIAPHLSNPTFINKSDRNNVKKLAYDINVHADKLKAIGDYAKKYKHRITFHPGQFVVIGSPNPDVVTRSSRELYMHALILDTMGVDYNSIMVVHGGGVYCDKMGTISRWARNFHKLPIEVKRRLVLENDETCYNTEDVLLLSEKLPEFPGCGKKYRIPIVFDIFHYHCYDETIKRRSANKQKCLKADLKQSHCAAPKKQKPISYCLPKILQSWGGRRPKMHLSEQAPDSVLGKHSDYVKKIPKWAADLEIDIMIEAKAKELTVIALCEKYKIPSCKKMKQ